MLQHAFTENCKDKIIHTSQIQVGIPKALITIYPDTLNDYGQSRMDMAASSA